MSSQRVGVGRLCRLLYRTAGEVGIVLEAGLKKKGTSFSS